MTESTEAPARFTRSVLLPGGKVVPANTDTTAEYVAGDSSQVQVWYQGERYVVRTNSVRFL